MSTLAKAYDLASAAHEGQTDKIGVPYIYHVLVVSEIIQRMPSYSSLTDEDKINAIIASVLHDIVEDTHVTFQDLEAEGFHPTVVKAVELLTYDNKTSREEYYQGIITHPIARLVKTGDLAHNNLHSRRVGLPVEQQTRLEEKYRKAIEMIVMPEDYQSFVELISKTD